MKKKEKRRNWVKPELKILVKGQAEEAVLGSCKNHYAMLENGPGSFQCSTILGYFCSQDSAS